MISIAQHHESLSNYRVVGNPQTLGFLHFVSSLRFVCIFCKLNICERASGVEFLWKNGISEKQRRQQTTESWRRRLFRMTLSNSESRIGRKWWRIIVYLEATELLSADHFWWEAVGWMKITPRGKSLSHAQFNFKFAFSRVADNNFVPTDSWNAICNGNTLPSGVNSRCFSRGALFYDGTAEKLKRNYSQLPFFKTASVLRFYFYKKILCSTIRSRLETWKEKSRWHLESGRGEKYEREFSVEPVWIAIYSNTETYRNDSHLLSGGSAPRDEWWVPSFKEARFARKKKSCLALRLVARSSTIKVRLSFRFRTTQCGPVPLTPSTTTRKNTM